MPLTEDEVDAAVPTTTFSYSDAAVTTTTQNVQIDQELNDDIPSAPLIPRYEDLNSREKKEALALRQAKMMGKIAAESEKEDIRRADKDIGAIQYYATQGVKEANAVARQRNREGVQIQEDKWFGHEEEKPADQKDEDDSPFLNKGGYKVAAYDTQPYDTSEYNVTEYKSVYD